MMEKKKINEKDLQRYLKGACSTEERKRILLALSESDKLCRVMELLKALPEAARYAEPDEERWKRLQIRTMAKWREETSLKAKKNVSVLIMRPALAVMVILLVIGSAWWLGSSRSPTVKEASISQERQAKNQLDQQLRWPTPGFDTGVPEPGVRAKLHIEIQGGNSNLVALAAEDHRMVQGGDEIHTAADGIIRLELDERAVLTLMPDSRLRFHTYLGKVLPYLVSGTLLCKIKHDESRGFVLLAHRVRFVDIGTIFSVSIAGDGGGKLDVNEGAVRLERPGVAPKSLAAGASAGWRNNGELTRVSAGHSGPEVMRRAEELIKKLRARAYRPPAGADPIEIKPEIKPPLADDSPKPEKIFRKGEDTRVERTTWQQTMDDMPLSHREAVSHFYEVAMEQMNSGYSMRAIANLENFISEHPGPESEQARFLLAECHYNLQEFDKALVEYMAYIQTYPEGAWIEMAKFRFVSLRETKGK